LKKRCFNLKSFSFS